MAVESKRGCGFRQAGGIYLVAPELTRGCDRLPFDLPVCPLCGSGFKPTRGFTWLRKPEIIFGGEHKKCADPKWDPICYPGKEPMLLLWLSGQQYTQLGFMEEAQKMGVSRKVPRVPRGFKPGETYVCMASRARKAKTTMVKKGEKKERVVIPAREAQIFCVFRPKLEAVITEKAAKDKKLMNSLEKRGFNVVTVPDDDADHNPKKLSVAAQKRRLMGAK